MVILWVDSKAGKLVAMMVDDLVALWVVTKVVEMADLTVSKPAVA